MTVACLIDLDFHYLRLSTHRRYSQLAFKVGNSSLGGVLLIPAASVLGFFFLKLVINEFRDKTSLLVVAIRLSAGSSGSYEEAPVLRGYLQIRMVYWWNFLTSVHMLVHRRYPSEHCKTHRQVRPVRENRPPLRCNDEASTLYSRGF